MGRGRFATSLALRGEGPQTRTSSYSHTKPTHLLGGANGGPEAPLPARDATRPLGDRKGPHLFSQHEENFGVCLVDRQSR